MSHPVMSLDVAFGKFPSSSLVRRFAHPFAFSLLRSSFCSVVRCFALPSFARCDLSLAFRLLLVLCLSFQPLVLAIEFVSECSTVYIAT